jgi:XTP/dITP diphosphohydrolase
VRDGVTDVTFVSSNPGKFREARALLRPFGVELAWHRQTLREPQADSLAEVALAKLDAVRKVGGYVLVEDSGLFIPSLQGFPGVYSAHFLTTWGFGPVLELLRHRDRRAYFRTVAALGRNGRRWTFTGEVRGTIAARPRGRNGFGYDPIFVPAGWTRTFAEATAEAKNRVSHRARAIRKVGRYLSGRPPRKSRCD